MIPPYSRDDEPVMHRCRVCTGAGGWDRGTGAPATKPDPDAPGWRLDAWVRCPYCSGKGTA